MGYIRVCDKCRKRIKERPYVSADLGLDSFMFHSVCALSIVKFLEPFIAKKERAKNRKRS